MPNNKRSSGIGVYIAILLVGVLMFSVFTRDKVELTEKKYTEIVGYFQKGEVDDFSWDLDNGKLTFNLKGSTEEIIYQVPDASMFYNDIKDHVSEKIALDPEFSGDVLPPKTYPWWVSFLPMLLLMGLLAVFWIYMMRQSKGGASGIGNFGKSKARTGNEGIRVTFDDVAGAEEEKQELVEIVEFLRNPGKFNALGARIPKGVILVGPPGTGKTLLARAVAGEADVQFYSISGSDFVEMFVGVGASRVRDLFEKAKKSAPSIVFIDEIDAVGRQRGTGLGGGHDEREQTLNQLLVEMDGFSTNTGVIVMAATNRSDVLDPALLRPGRFDREITVGYPDVKGREEILKVHSRNKPLAPDVELSVIARTTVGFTGADLENLMNESALLAARRNKKAITMDEVAESTIKVVAGPEKRSKVITESERRLTAYHEAGHAVTSFHIPTQDPVHQVSIIPRGMAGGYTLSLPEKDISYRTKKQMEGDIVVLMGGRVAEQLVLGDISTGASNDLERATKITNGMVTKYGFSDAIGPIVYGGNQEQVFLGRDYFSGRDMSEEVASKIDNEVHAIITSCYKRTEEILKENMDQLEIIAQALLEREKLESDEFDTLMRGGTLPAVDRTKKEEPPVKTERPTPPPATPNVPSMGDYKITPGYSN